MSKEYGHGFFPRDSTNPVSIAPCGMEATMVGYERPVVHLRCG
jgi:hypothetical protein